MPPRPSDPVIVDIRRGSRVQMKAKDSIWVVERKGVMEHKSVGSNEVILCEDNGNVREGASSNFFVIKDDGKLYTTLQGVLKGTVLTMLLNIVVKTVNQEVVYEIPNLKDISRWKEAAITSTSRLILPIHSFVISSDCIQFLDSAAKSRLEKSTESDNYILRLLADDKQSPISQLLNVELISHMLEMSESLELDRPN